MATDKQKPASLWTRFRTAVRVLRGDVIAQPRLRATNAPYDAGGTGRRAQGWVASRLGSSTLLWGNLDQIRARSHDAVRNNPWAASAVDAFERNVVGTGIQPHWQTANEDARRKIQAAWNRWMNEADFAGQSDFYGLQALAAREVYEGGEVFCRHRLRNDRNGFMPYRLQLIEGEQCPVFRNIMPTGTQNIVRMGIEFDPAGRRVAYHMYREHPGETMFYPLDALQFIEIPASDIEHIYKPLRIGQLRGQPFLTSVLALLYELDQYEDATVVRRKVSAMFTGFITKTSDSDQVMPPNPNTATPPNVENPVNPSYTVYQDPGTDNMKMEPGTLQQLYPGESITFPSVPEDRDLESFLYMSLHKFAAGCGGLTYEQITGDLKGVNYSSIRAGLLEFRRGCEQFQYNVLIHQFCDPVLRRFLREAVLSGALDLPEYLSNPAEFEDVIWVPPGWQWVDPAKEMAAYQMGVRSGFTSRTMVVRGTGQDPEVIDAQQVEERARAAKQGIIYDSDPNKVLMGRETNPVEPTQAKPTPETEDDADVAAYRTFGNRPPRSVQR